MVNFYAWLLATILLFFNPGNFSDKNFLVGDYLGYQGNYIYLKNEEINKYPYNEKTLLALKGPQKGRLLTLEDFPVKIPVLISLKAGQVQMMSNLPQNLKYKPGTKLPSRALRFFESRKLLIQFSGKKDCTFIILTVKRPLFIRKQPSAWDNLGTKIAFTTSRESGIYHLDKKKNYSFISRKKPELIRVVFIWNGRQIMNSY